LFTSIGKIFPEGTSSIKRFLDHLERINTKAKTLAFAGLSAEEIRNNIFFRESSMAPLTGGHYSIQNLVDKLLSR